MDLHHFSRRLDRIVDAIENSKDEWDFSEKNRKSVIDFYQQLVAEGISAGRIIKYLYFLRDFERMLKKDFEKADKSDVIRIVSNVEGRKDWSDWTKRDFKNELKRFYRWMRGTTPPGYPEEVAWIRTKKIKDPRFPEEFLNEGDVEKMINAANNPRDKAFVHSLYESACRPGELLTCLLKSVQFDEYGAVLIVFGKTGMRRIRLIDSARDLRAWVQSHPFKDNPEAPLWVSTHNFATNGNPDNLSYNTMNEVIQNIAKHAGIKKRVNPYAFRHSRATFLSKYLTDAELKVFLGHTQESRATAVYIHLSGKDIDDKLLKVYGIKKETLKELNKPKPFATCPRCKEVNNADEIFCTKCWLPLNPQARQMVGVDKGIGLYPTMVELIKKHPEINPDIFWDAVKINNKHTEKMLKDLEKTMKKDEVFSKKWEEFENQKQKGEK